MKYCILAPGFPKLYFLLLVFPSGYFGLKDLCCPRPHNQLPILAFCADLAEKENIFWNPHLQKLYAQ